MFDIILFIGTIIRVANGVLRQMRLQSYEDFFNYARKKRKKCCFGGIFMEPTSDVGVKEEKIGAERSVAGTHGYSREH